MNVILWSELQCDIASIFKDDPLIFCAYPYADIEDYICDFFAQRIFLCHCTNSIKIEGNVCSFKKQVTLGVILPPHKISNRILCDIINLGRHYKSEDSIIDFQL